MQDGAMAMSIGREGHGPSEVTCRIGGDRPGCDFMITTLAERWADTGISTGRLILAVLGNAGNTWVVRPRLTDAQKEEARRRRAEGATLAELARSYDVSMSTISRL